MFSGANVFGIESHEAETGVIPDVVFYAVGNPYDIGNGEHKCRRCSWHNQFPFCTDIYLRCTVGCMVPETDPRMLARKLFHSAWTVRHLRILDKIKSQNSGKVASAKPGTCFLKQLSFKIFWFYNSSLISCKYIGRKRLKKIDFSSNGGLKKRPNRTGLADLGQCVLGTQLKSYSSLENAVAAK